MRSLSCLRSKICLLSVFFESSLVDESGVPMAAGEGVDFVLGSGGGNGEEGDISERPNARLTLEISGKVRGGT